MYIFYIKSWEKIVSIVILISFCGGIYKLRRMLTEDSLREYFSLQNFAILIILKTDTIGNWHNWFYFCQLGYFWIHGQKIPHGSQTIVIQYNIKILDTLFLFYHYVEADLDCLTYFEVLITWLIFAFLE